MAVSSTANQPHSVQRIALLWMPNSWTPYAELIRLHKPVGIFNIYLPYLLGCLLAACLNEQAIGPLELALSAAQMLIAAFILRSLGCAWNDIVDRDVDRQTNRCKNRPVARGAISVTNGTVFTVGLLLLWSWTSAQVMTRSAALYAIPVPFLTGFYPFAKGITNFAQLVLGITLSFGVLVGAAQLNVDLVSWLSKSEDYQKAYSLIALFAAYVVFSLVHDTIYAFQDLMDDKKTESKSMAVLFADYPRALLSALNVLQIGTLIAIGSFGNFDGGWYTIACLGVGLLYSIALVQLDVEKPSSCWLWFKRTSLGFGILVILGFLSQYGWRI